MSESQLAAEMCVLGIAARDAARTLREASTETKNKALRVAAAAIRAHAPQIKSANAEDMAHARDEQLSGAMLVEVTDKMDDVVARLKKKGANVAVGSRAGTFAVEMNWRVGRGRTVSISRASPRPSA